MCWLSYWRGNNLLNNLTRDDTQRPRALQLRQSSSINSARYFKHRCQQPILSGTLLQITIFTMARIRPISFLGGMTYHSTVPYYSQINSPVQRRLGSPHTATLLMHSFNFAEIGRCFSQGLWSEAAAMFIAAGRNLKASGVESLVIGCNVGHKVFKELEDGTGLPVLHIADATAKELVSRGIKRVGLLGTKPVMQDDYIKGPLQHRAGLDDVIVPQPADWDRLNDIVFNELAAGRASDESATWMKRLVKKLQDKGAEAIVWHARISSLSSSPKTLLSLLSIRWSSTPSMLPTGPLQMSTETRNRG